MKVLCYFSIDFTIKTWKDLRDNNFKLNFVPNNDVPNLMIFSKTPIFDKNDLNFSSHLGEDTFMAIANRLLQV